MCTMIHFFALVFPFILLQLHFEIVFCWIVFGSVVVTSVVGKRRWERFLWRKKIRFEKKFCIVFHYPNPFSCFNHKCSTVNLFDFFLPMNFHVNLFLLLLCHLNLCLAHWRVVWVRGKWVMQIFKISLMLSIYFPTFFSPPVLLSVFFLFIFHRNKLFFLSPFFLPFLYSFQLRR